MKVGDLVKWRHPDEPAIGLVGKIEYEDDTSYIYWSDGDSDWYDNDDLWVLSEGR